MIEAAAMSSVPAAKPLAEMASAEGADARHGLQSVIECLPFGETEESFICPPDQNGFRRDCVASDSSEASARRVGLEGNGGTRKRENEGAARSSNGRSPVPEEADAALPVNVQRLAPREREVATLVYRNDPLTANAVLAQVSGKVGNAAVRSMLRRLVAKGIVNRRKDGGVKAFEYCPAITNAVSAQAAIRRLAEDHFEGSIASVARAVLDLVARYDKPLLHDLERRTGA